MAQKPKLSIYVASGILCLAIESCTPRVDHRGKLPDPEIIAKIQPAKHNKEDVLHSMGSPSAYAAFDDNIWIYDYKITETTAFFLPVETMHKLYRICFNPQGKVKEIHVEDGYGHDIVPVRRATPSPGDDTTILQSIFGNFGRKAKQSKDHTKED